jgi:NTE family protein
MSIQEHDDNNIDPSGNKSDPIITLGKIDKLVLSGGGMKGCVHIGVLQYLEELGLIKQIEYFSGASIGSLICTLFVMGYNSEGLKQVINHFDYKRYQSIDILNFSKNFGIEDFSKLHSFINLLFITKGYNYQTTFEQLFTKTGKHLYINAVCLNTNQNVFFNHISSPTMPIMIAVQASMAIPFIFGSVNYKGLTYVDGGLLNNFPLDFNDLCKDNPASIFGVNISNIKNHSVSKISTFDEYVEQLKTCIFDTYIVNSLKDWEKANILDIYLPMCHALNVDLSVIDKENLFLFGYEKAKKFCALIK